MSKMTPKWINFYLGLAEYVASASKDPSTKVGAVIVSPYNSVISVGFNGFPVGVSDYETRLNDRHTKYKMIVHAESNALAFANQSVRDCTIFTWPFMPCSTCAGSIIQSGIKNVIAPRNDHPRWAESFGLTRIMFAEAGVNLLEWENGNKKDHT